MLAAARRLLVIVAALFLSAGHVACACVASSAPMSLAAEAATADGHAHHHPGTKDAGEKNAPGPGHSDCSHCKSVALTGDPDGKSAALPALTKNFAFAVSALPSSPRELSVGVRAQRLHWAAPPRRTPVSLKIRLRN